MRRMKTRAGLISPGLLGLFALLMTAGGSAFGQYVPPGMPPAVDLSPFYTVPDLTQTLVGEARQPPGQGDAEADRLASTYQALMGPRGIGLRPDVSFGTWAALTTTSGPLGLSLAPVGETLRAQLDLPDGRGVVVADLAPEGRGAKSGVEKNDILLAVGKRPVASAADLDAARLAGDDAETLTVLRAGREKILTLAAGEPLHFVARLVDPSRFGEFWIGVSVSHVDETLRAHLNLPEGLGLVAADIVNDSPADRAGVKPHDILLEMDGQSLRKPQDLIDKIQAAGSAGKAVPLKVVRSRHERTIPVRPEKRKEGQKFFRLHQQPANPIAPGAFNFVGPGVIVDAENPRLHFTPEGQPQQGLNWVRVRPAPPAPSGGMGAGSGPGSVGPVEKRLDDLLGRIRDLDKTVEELGRELGRLRSQQGSQRR